MYSVFVCCQRAVRLPTMVQWKGRKIETGFFMFAEASKVLEGYLHGKLYVWVLETIVLFFFWMNGHFMGYFRWFSRREIFLVFYSIILIYLHFSISITRKFCFCLCSPNVFQLNLIFESRISINKNKKNITKLLLKYSFHINQPFSHSSRWGFCSSRIFNRVVLESPSDAPAQRSNNPCLGLANFNN